MSQQTRPPLPPLIKHPAQPEKSEWAKFIAGFGYASHGLWYAICTQRNARVHLTIGFLAILAGIVLHITAVDFALLFLAASSVFISEMINTAIEICVDLASPEYHPLAKIAKDVAAGAVLANAILSIIVGLCIFGPYLWHLL
jgi:diacylglycerol kinase